MSALHLISGMTSSPVLLSTALCCMQVFVSTEVASQVGGLKALTSTGTSILVQGTLRRTPEGTLQVHVLPSMTPCMQEQAACIAPQL